MDFESVFKVILMIAAAVAIPVAAYAAVAATRAIWVRPPHPAPGPEPEELESLRSRVAELEGLRARMLELEERVDFTERVLAQQRDPARLAGGAGDR
jgi:Tfp pilus assembly protein PilO